MGRLVDAKHCAYSALPTELQGHTTIVSSSTPGNTRSQQGAELVSEFRPEPGLQDGTCRALEVRAEATQRRGHLSCPLKGAEKEKGSQAGQRAHNAEVWGWGRGREWRRVAEPKAKGPGDREGALRGGGLEVPAVDFGLLLQPSKQGGAEWKGKAPLHSSAHSPPGPQETGPRRDHHASN